MGEVMKGYQPFIQYSTNPRISRENNTDLCLSEALIRLDIARAVRHIRRFNYVCKVLHLILDSRLSSLSGTAQKQVFSILEAASEQVLETDCNMHMFRDLLKSADLALEKGKKSHIGSEQLWTLHEQRVNNIHSKVDAYRIKEREQDGKLTIMDLPVECIRGILSCLADHKDILHTSQTSQTIYQFSQEGQLWKQLCFFHFTDRQMTTFLTININEPTTDWKSVYRKCNKKFGKKVSYADTLAICLHCHRIFWKLLGHPCYSEEKPASTQLPPEEFLKLFYL